VGGQVVIDFIEMKEHKHCREVEKSLRNALKEDKARTTVGKISRFGLLEMVRQRMGSSALSTTWQDCPACQGSGYVRSLEWQALQALKDIARQMQSKKGPNPVEYTVDRELGAYLLNCKRRKICEMEDSYATQVLIKSE
jgi:ribonuclease E